MKQSVAEFRMYRYRLQPGDGTRYEFFIVPLEQRTATQSSDADDPDLPHLAETDISYLVGGVGSGRDFVQLGICMPGQGSYEVRKSSLRDPQPHFIGYLSGKMGELSPYTIAAVVLAASVLVDEPMALEEAAKEMLRASELLQ